MAPDLKLTDLEKELQKALNKLPILPCNGSLAPGSIITVDPSSKRPKLSEVVDVWGVGNNIPAAGNLVTVPNSSMYNFDVSKGTSFLAEVTGLEIGDVTAACAQLPNATITSKSKIQLVNPQTVKLDNMGAILTAFVNNLDPNRLHTVWDTHIFNSHEEVTVLVVTDTFICDSFEVSFDHTTTIAASATVDLGTLVGVPANGSLELNFTRMAGTTVGAGGSNLRVAAGYRAYALKAEKGKDGVLTLRSPPQLIGQEAFDVKSMAAGQQQPTAGNKLNKGTDQYV